MRLIASVLLQRAACLALVAFLSALTTSGCGIQCDRNPDQAAIPWKEGLTRDPATPSAYYESAPVTGPYLDFPPGRTYRFFHDLGAPPAQVIGYFSFDEYPVAGSNSGPDKSGSVPGAGNQITWERGTATSFDVRNDTCSGVRLRVVASLPEFATPEAGSSPVVASDAGTDAR